MEYFRFFTHYFMHIILPLGISWFFFKQNWKRAYLLFLCTMLVDIDHVFANPIFDPNRKSIGFHPLHTYPMIGIYFIGFLASKNLTLRILFCGLVLHMITDFQDYYFWKFLAEEFN